MQRLLMMWCFSFVCVDAGVRPVDALSSLSGVCFGRLVCVCVCVCVLFL